MIHDYTLTNGETVKIRTSSISPPYWHAVLDNYEPGDPIGSSLSEQEAINDLVEQLEGDIEVVPLSDALEIINDACDAEARLRGLQR